VNGDHQHICLALECVLNTVGVVGVDVNVGDALCAVAAEGLDRKDRFVEIAKPACPVWEAVVGAARGGVDDASVLEEFTGEHRGPGGGRGAAVDFGENRVHVGAKGVAGFDVFADGLIFFRPLQGRDVVGRVE